MVDRDTFLDFITSPYWPEMETVLARLIRQLEGTAARTEKDHEYQRGRLAGAERALLALQEWRKATKQELVKSARHS